MFFVRLYKPSAYVISVKVNTSIYSSNLQFFSGEIPLVLFQKNRYSFHLIFFFGFQLTIFK